jgi:hypothetical protein
MDLLGLFEHFACDRTLRILSSDTYRRAAIASAEQALMLGLRVWLVVLPAGAYRRSHSGDRYTSMPLALPCPHAALA